MSRVRSERDMQVILNIEFGPPSTRFTAEQKRSMVSDALFAKTGRRHALSTLLLSEEVEAVMLFGNDNILVTSVEALRRGRSANVQQPNAASATRLEKSDACQHIKVKTYPWDALQCKSLVPNPLHAAEAM